MTRATDNSWSGSAPAAGLALSLVCVVLFATAASAHVVVGTKSLHLRVAEAKAVIRGRVTHPSATFVSADGRTRRALVEIAPIEVLKGPPVGASLRFAQDGHAVATYQAGEEALFFLNPIAESRELRAIAVPGGPTHVSSQEHGEEFRLGTGTAPVLLGAVRAYAASESADSPGARLDLIRGATLDLLTSGDDSLASSALASLVMSPHAEWIQQDDLPRLKQSIRDASVSVGFRSGLIAELERRGWIDGDFERLALLKGTEAKALPRAIRALASHPSGILVEFLLERLEPTRTVSSEVAAEAAIALGTSQDERATSALAQILKRDDARSRSAAIRALGMLQNDAALAILRDASTSHPDPATRRRADAERRKVLSRREAGAEARS